MEPQTKPLLGIFAGSNGVRIRVNTLSSAGKNTVTCTRTFINCGINPGRYRMITEIPPHLHRFCADATPNI